MQRNEPASSHEHPDLSDEEYRQACEAQIREYLAFHYNDHTDYDIEIIGNVAYVGNNADTTRKEGER